MALTGGICGDGRTNSSSGDGVYGTNLSTDVLCVGMTGANTDGGAGIFGARGHSEGTTWRR